MINTRAVVTEVSSTQTSWSVGVAKSRGVHRIVSVGRRRPVAEPRGAYDDEVSDSRDAPHRNAASTARSVTRCALTYPGQVTFTPAEFRTGNRRPARAQTSVTLRE